jgi:NAD(P)-dependent dehydrogenase (short-subunit alcohol dehydrogenase family)
MKTVLVVGGSHGIGQAIVKNHLADHRVISISRTSAEVTDSNFTEHLLDVRDGDLPEIDALDSIIYCPGSIQLKPISSLKEETLRADFEINVVGAYRIIKQYHKILKHGVNPSIVMFSTVAVAQGMPFHVSVAAAKGGVEGMVKTLAAEFAPSIRVNAIAPTITDTPLAAGLLRNEKMREKMKERHPLKRILDVDEVASMASYLISDQAKSITGQIIGIDAGMSIVRN